MTFESRAAARAHIEGNLRYGSPKVRRTEELEKELEAQSRRIAENRRRIAREMAETYDDCGEGW